MIVCLYTGEDGQSHLENVNNMPGHGERVALAPGAEFMFSTSPGGYFNSWHASSRRHYAIVLSGEMEIGASDGSVRRLRPGDLLLAEDVTGKGHTTRIVDGPSLRVSVSLPE